MNLTKLILSFALSLFNYLISLLSFAILNSRFDYSYYAIREHSLIMGETELEEIELGSDILLHAGTGV